MKIFVAIPTNRDLPWLTAHSLIETLLLFNAKGIQFNHAFITGCSLVDKARNIALDHFLKSDCDRLLMIDSDMAWNANDALRLVWLSTKMDCVGVTGPAKKEPTEFFVRDLDSDATDYEVNEWGCISVRGFGLCFTIVTRPVLEKLAAEAPTVLLNEGLSVKQVFKTDVVDGQYIGEDAYFFDQVTKSGTTVYLDPSITLGHIGDKVYSGNWFEQLQQPEEKERIHVPKILLPLHYR